MKLAACVIWDSPFMFSDSVDTIWNLEHPEGYDVKFFRGRGWCPARRHNMACEKAVEWGAEVICILGADQKYEPDLLPRLIGRLEEGYPSISALVPCRGFVGWQEMKPFQPMAWRFKANAPGDFTARSYQGEALDPGRIEVIQRNTGVQPIHFIGSGVLMFPTQLITNLSKPWFKESVEDDSPSSGYNRVANMDCTFMWKLQSENGVRAYVDTDIRVKHLNIFSIDDSFSDRFADWAEEGKGDPALCAFKKRFDIGGELHRKRQDFLRKWAGANTYYVLDELEYASDPESIIEDIKTKDDVVIGVPNFKVTKEQVRQYNIEMLREQVSPYIQIEDEAEMSWQYVSQPYKYKWLFVRGIVK